MTLDAYSVAQFCASHGISRALFYKLQKAGRAPAIMKISANRVAISREAAEKWRREREAEAAMPETTVSA
jgi:predicted DNA-binding transcriptional regulator AlpA